MDVLLQPTEQKRVRAAKSGGRERVAVGGGQKNVHRPWPLAPLVFTFGFLTCLTITAFTDGRHGRDAGALCGAAEAGSAADGF